MTFEVNCSLKQFWIVILSKKTKVFVRERRVLFIYNLLKYIDSSFGDFNKIRLFKFNKLAFILFLYLCKDASKDRCETVFWLFIFEIVRLLIIYVLTLVSISQNWWIFYCWNQESGQRHHTLWLKWNKLSETYVSSTNRNH